MMLKVAQRQHSAEQYHKKHYWWLSVSLDKLDVRIGIVKTKYLSLKFLLI